MIVKQEPYGFTVEIDRSGKTPVRLTFEEVYNRRNTRKYYCCVDVGLYRRMGNRVNFERLGSFEIQDWFKMNTELKMRSKLKRLLGVVGYDNLIKLVESIKNGNYVSADSGRELAVV